MFFKCKVGDKTYELEKLSLGDARTLKREFGLSDLEDLNPTDPDQLVGLIYLAIVKANPDVQRAAALAEAEGIDVVEWIETAQDDEAVEPDPTPASSEASDPAEPAVTSA